MRPLILPLKRIIILCLCVVSISQLAIGQAFELESTTGGILLPRMTEMQRDNISSPSTGELIYQTDGTSGFYYYNGSNWTLVGTGGGSSESTSVLHASSNISRDDELDYAGLGVGNADDSLKVWFPITRTGTLKNFHILFSHAVLSGSDVTVTVWVNGVAAFAKKMENADGNSYSDTISSYSVNQGDYVYITFQAGEEDPTDFSNNFLYMSITFELSG